MSKRKLLPEAVDEAGGLLQISRKTVKEMDYSDLGVDGQERICYSSDPFCQGTEYDFDEFH